MKPSKEIASVFTRFLAGLLIAGQPAWGLPPVSADTLRPSIQGVQGGLEEILNPAGLEERIGLRLGPGNAVDFVLENVQQRIVPGRGLVFQVEPPSPLLQGMYLGDAGMEADLQRLRQMLLDGYEAVAVTGGQINADPIVRWAQDRIHSGFQPRTAGVLNSIQYEDFLDDLLWDLFLRVGELARPLRGDGAVSFPRFKLSEPLREEPYLGGPASTRIWIARAQRIEGPTTLTGSAYSDVAVYDPEVARQKMLRFHDSVAQSLKGLQEIQDLLRQIRQQDEQGYFRLMEDRTEDEERRHAQDYAWTFRFFGRTLRKHLARKVLAAEALVEPGSFLDRAYWTPAKLSGDAGRMQNTGDEIVELAGQVGARLKRMEILLAQGKDEWAYAFFWLFLLEKMNEWARSKRGANVGQSPAYQGFVARAVLNYLARAGYTTPEALANAFAEGGAQGAASRGRESYEFLSAFYDENFLTDPERERLFNEESVAGLEENQRELQPLEVPARMIFLGHAGISAQEEEWLEQQLRKALTGVEPIRPVHLWMERAAPLNFPEIEQIEQALAAHDLGWELFEQGERGVGWRYLRERFDAGRSLERQVSPEQVVQQMVFKGDPLSSAVQRVANEWRKEGRTVIFHAEEAPWSAVQNIVRRWYLDRRIRESVGNGQLEQGLDALRKRRQYRRLYIPERDDSFAKTLAATHRSEPSEVHLGVRGGAHEMTTEQALRREGIQVQSIVQPLDITANPDSRASEWLFTGPDDSMPIARQDRLDREELIGLPLTVFVQTTLQRVLPARNSVNAFVASLPDALLQDWMTDPVSRSGNGDRNRLGRNSWDWLGERQHSMTDLGKQLYVQLTEQMTGTAGLEEADVSREEIERLIDEQRGFVPTPENPAPSHSSKDLYKDVAAVLAETKPAAVIPTRTGDVKAQALVEEARRRGFSVLEARILAYGIQPHYIVTAKAIDAEAIADLYQRFRRGEIELPQYDTEFGRRLGYSPEAIGVFQRRLWREGSFAAGLEEGRKINRRTLLSVFLAAGIGAFVGGDAAREPDPRDVAREPQALPLSEGEGAVIYRFLEHTPEKLEEIPDQVREVQRQFPGREIVVVEERSWLNSLASVAGYDPEIAQAIRDREEIPTGRDQRPDLPTEQMLQGILDHERKATLADLRVQEEKEYRNGVRIEVEEPSLSSVMANIREELARERAFAALYIGRNKELFFREMITSFLQGEASVRIRDDLFKEQLEQLMADHPGAILFVWRGLGHRDIAKTIDHEKHRFKAMVQEHEVPGGGAVTFLEEVGRKIGGPMIGEGMRQRMEAEFPRIAVMAALLMGGEVSQDEAMRLAREVMEAVLKKEGKISELTRAIQEEVARQKEGGGFSNEETQRRYVRATLDWLSKEGFLSEAVQKLMGPIPSEEESRSGLEEKRLSEMEFAARVNSLLSYRLNLLDEMYKERIDQLEQDRDWREFMRYVASMARAYDRSESPVTNMDVIAKLDPSWVADRKWTRLRDYYRYHVREAAQMMFGVALTVEISGDSPERQDQVYLPLLRAISAANFLQLRDLISGTPMIFQPETALSDPEWDRLMALADASWDYFTPIGLNALLFNLPTGPDGSFVPSSLLLTAELMKRAGMRSDSHLVEAGAGMGHASVVANSVFGASADGYEILREMAEESAPAWHAYLGKLGLADPGRIRITTSDIFSLRRQDLEGATHMHLFAPGSFQFTRRFDQWLVDVAPPGMRLMVNTASSLFDPSLGLEVLFPKMHRAGWRNAGWKDLSGTYFVPPRATGLEEQWQGMRSAAQGDAAVVIGPSVAAQFGGLEELARLDGGRRIFVDRGADTALQMLETGIQEARYYGGLEEAGVFQRMVAGAVSVFRHAPTEGPFLAQVEAVLRLAGVPEPMVRAGLEEFAAQLDAVDVGA